MALPGMRTFDSLTVLQILMTQDLSQRIDPVAPIIQIFLLPDRPAPKGYINVETMNSHPLR